MVREKVRDSRSVGFRIHNTELAIRDAFTNLGASLFCTWLVVVTQDALRLDTRVVSHHYQQRGRQHTVTRPHTRLRLGPEPYQPREQKQSTVGGRLDMCIHLSVMGAISGVSGQRRESAVVSGVARVCGASSYLALELP